VVIIVASDQNGQREALGSGFVVSHGKIATNHHVVEGMNQAYIVFSDGAVKPISSVVADSIQQDLRILAVETGNRPPLPFGDELSLQQGDSVYALGAPKVWNSPSQTGS
jgi:S1-C subfamily serine protease